MNNKKKYLTKGRTFALIDIETGEVIDKFSDYAVIVETKNNKNKPNIKYKNRKHKREKICGIYKIYCKTTRKCYIGKSEDIYSRWMRHKYTGSTKENACKYGCENKMYYDMAKYGVDDFEFEIIEKCTSDKLTDLEFKYIKMYSSTVSGYNKTLGTNVFFDENGQHAYSNLSYDDVEEICKMLIDCVDKNEIIKKFDTTKAIVDCILHCKTFDCITNKYENELKKSIEKYNQKRKRTIPNINKLDVGMVFKNKKALCEFLDIKYRQSGKGKIDDEKLFSRYFNYSKIGNTRQIVITEILSDL